MSEKTYNLILISDLDGDLGLFDVRDNSFKKLGNIGIEITDVATTPDGQVYAIDYGNLYRLDLDSLTHDRLFALTSDLSNGLEFGSKDDHGWLIVTDAYGDWTEYSLSGEIEKSADIPESFLSSGDAAFFNRGDKGYVTMSVQKTSFFLKTDALYTYEYTSETGEFLSSFSVSHGIDDLWGLASAGENKSDLYGFSGSSVYTIDPFTGSSSVIADLASYGFNAIGGAATVNYKYDEKKEDSPVEPEPASAFRSPILQSDLKAGGIDAAVHWTSYEGHGGLDFSAEDADGNSLHGVSVHAAADGWLYRASEHETDADKSFGDVVILWHGENTYSVYGHLSGYSPTFKEFQNAVSSKGPLPDVEVLAGDVIGFVGNTGKSSGPHLHFSVVELDDDLKPNRTGKTGFDEASKSQFLWKVGEERTSQYDKVRALSAEIAALADQPIHVVDIADGYTKTPPGRGSTTWDVRVDDGSTESFEYTGSIERPGDKDWLKFSVQEGQVYEVNVTGKIVNGYKSLADSFFTIQYEVSPGVFKFDSEAGPSARDAAGVTETRTFLAAEAADYFIVVGGGDGDGDVDTEEYKTVTGGYSVSVTRKDIASEVIVAKDIAETTELSKPTEDRVIGTIETLDGDRIIGFSVEDTLIFKAVEFLRKALTVTFGSAILDIDIDGDGRSESTVKLEGDYQGAEFAVTNVDGNTHINVIMPEPRRDQVLYGESGPDRLYGRDGDDRIHGRAGADRLYGGDDADWVYGGDGADRVYGGSGNDRVYGNSGNDRAYGNSGSDRLYGGSGDDRVYGGSGNDRVYGNSGSDRVYGNSGKDKLYGGTSKDKLYGGSGNDELTGNKGADLLVGGKGADDFNFRKVSDSTKKSMDTIDGFGGAGRKGGDQIDVSKIDAVKGSKGNQNFDFDGGHGKGHLWAEDDGRDTMIYGNIDNDRFAEIQIRIEDGRGTSAEDYFANDFIL